MTVATGQLSLLARPEVVVEYRPWEWLCSRNEAVPFRGGFCAYIRHVPAGVGFGRVADTALADLARDLRSEAEESPSVDQLTTQGQVVMAARALETSASRPSLAITPHS